MSWYADIRGEVETALAALPMVRKFFGDWMKPGDGDAVALDPDREKRKLLIRFDGCYRNLGRYLEHDLWRLARRYPKATSGEFHMYSTDGETFFAAYRVADGKIYLRGLSLREEELVPHPIPIRGVGAITLMVGKAAADRLKAQRGRKRHAKD